MYGAILGALAGLADAGSQIGNFFHNENVFRQQRAYNSPAAQVARLQAAGINPQGVTAQIAGQNQGDFNKADFDFGKSFSTATSVANGFGNYEKLANEIEGLKLDNMFKTSTFNDRVNDVSLLVYKHYLDNLLSQGKITEQSYTNMLLDYNLEWQKYLAGEPSKHQHLEFYSDDGVDYVNTVRSPRASRYISENTIKSLDAQYKSLTLDPRTRYDYAKLNKVLADAARAAVALKYEQLTGSPFNAKDPWLNFGINVIRKLGLWGQQHPNDKFPSPLELFNLIMDIDI